MTLRTLLRRVLPAGALLAAAAAGCNPATDELLLRFTGFHTAGSPTAPPIATADVDVADGKNFVVDATFENASDIAGSSSGGTGIRVYGVQVGYQMAGAAPPASVYATELYLPPPGTSGAGTGAATTAGTGTIPGLPLVTIALKEWLAEKEALEEERTDLAVAVLFLARTDEGRELRVEGRIRLVLVTGAGGGGGGTSDAVVTVQKTADASVGDGEDGLFTLSRTGDTTAPLTVSYSTSGSTATKGTHYEDIGTSQSFSAGSSTKEIHVTLLTTSTTDLPKTVVLTVQGGAGYSVGTPASATVTINP